MIVRQAAQSLLLCWHRIANPVRRFMVIGRYEGARSAWRAARQRFDDLFPGRRRTGIQTAMAGDLKADLRDDSVASLAAQAIAPPVVIRRSSASQPVVSVIVRTYNRPALLAQALTSLANQSYADFEVVVVDDGEVDSGPVLAQLAPFLDLRQAHHVSGSGRSAALNSGLAAARGRWITYLDDDDIVYPCHLELLTRDLNEKQRCAAYSDAIRALCWSDARIDEVVQSLPCATLDFDLRRLLVDNWIPLLTFIHSADCVDAVGPFDERLDLFEDWDFLIRMGQRCSFAHIPHYTCEYRHRFGPMPDRARSALRLRERVLEATQQIYQRYPVTGQELTARRRLTLAALQQDIREVRRIEERTTDPAARDLLIAARVGRFQDTQSLVQRYSARTPLPRA